MSLFNRHPVNPLQIQYALGQIIFHHICSNHETPSYPAFQASGPPPAFCKPYVSLTDHQPIRCLDSLQKAYSTYRRLTEGSQMGMARMLGMQDILTNSVAPLPLGRKKSETHT